VGKNASAVVVEGACLLAICGLDVDFFAWEMWFAQFSVRRVLL
jgi:hypothetical protein